MWTWPAAAATHKGGAPSIVSPSKVTKSKEWEKKSKTETI